MIGAALVLGLAISLPLAVGRIAELFIQARLQREIHASQLTAGTILFERVEEAFHRGLAAAARDSPEAPN